MSKRERDNPLLDLTPEDLRGDPSVKLAQLEASGKVSRAEIEEELRYLQIASARKAPIPDDAFFAGVRQRIHERVSIRPVTVWARLEAWLLPEWLKPTPALVGIAAVLLVAVIAVFSYHGLTSRVESVVAYGPYTPIGESYTQQVSRMDQGALSAEDMQRYREILTMSIGILGSPSSLSRSQALVGAGGRL
jgi:hypothetical protein